MAVVQMLSHKTKPNSSEDNANFYNNITTGMHFFLKYLIKCLKYIN